MQDAAQGFHWDNSQATLHPFVAYYQKDVLHHTTMCVISDCLKHDIITVHRFQQNAIAHLRLQLPEFRKLFYFSDGAASKHKNYKNFSNLTLQNEDFELDPE